MILQEFLYGTVVLTAAAVLAGAALSDARRFRIPNVLPLVLLVLFPAYVLTSPRPVVWEQHVLIACLVLVAGFLIYVRKLAGAGDIKLLGAASLWAGPEHLGVMLVVTTLAGGLLALVMACVVFFRCRKTGGPGLAAAAKTPIPYGVAIATGGLCTLILLFHPVSPS